MDQRNRGYDVHGGDAAGAAKSRPVKTAPVLDLEIDQQSKNHHHDCGRQNLLLVHERWLTRRSFAEVPE